MQRTKTISQWDHLFSCYYINQNMTDNPNTNQTKLPSTPNQPPKKVSSHPQKEVPNELIDQIPPAPQV